MVGEKFRVVGEFRKHFPGHGVSGDGWHRPARIATAYVTETPSADMMVGFAMPESSG
jgi:hypothetical protein